MVKICKNDKGNAVLNYPLQVLSWCGQCPGQTKTKYIIAALLYVFFAAVSIPATILQFFYAHSSTEVAQNCEALGGFLQVAGKMLVSGLQIKNLLTMIEDSKSFWSVTTLSIKSGINLEATFVTILRLEQFLVRLIVCTIIIVIMSPLFTKQLPTGLWLITDHNKLFTFVLIVEEIFHIPVAIFVAGSDCLFLSFCVLLRAQFTMLHYLLKDLNVSEIVDKTDEKRYLQKMKLYIQHHDFLLRFSRNLQNTYSPFMLTHYLTVLLLMIADMYAIFESENMLQVPRYILPAACCLLQLAFYCIPLNYVTDEAVSVCQGIYESNWYFKNVAALKTVVPLVIQRSQLEIVFKAGGLFEMNCRTILSVVRTAYSVCTIMRALKRV